MGENLREFIVCWSDLDDQASIDCHFPTSHTPCINDIGIINYLLYLSAIYPLYKIARRLGLVGMWPVAALVLVSSLVAVAYVMRIVEAMYFKRPPEGAPPLKEAPLALLIPTYVLVLASLYFGVDTELT